MLFRCTSYLHNKLAFITTNSVGFLWLINRQTKLYLVLIILVRKFKVSGFTCYRFIIPHKREWQSTNRTQSKHDTEWRWHVTCIIIPTSYLAVSLVPSHRFATLSTFTPLTPWNTFSCTIILHDTLTTFLIWAFNWEWIYLGSAFSWQILKVSSI